MLRQHYAYVVFALVALNVVVWATILFARAGYVPGEFSDLFVPISRYDPAP
jgi:hypothetical protein